MARRLFVVCLAVISLALLVQATPGLAETYDLESDPYNCVEVFPVVSGGQYTPGSVGSSFLGSNTWDGNLWEIGDWSGEENKALTNTVQATQEDLGDNLYTFVYTYDAIESGGQVKFKVSIPGEGVDITSYDAELTITATYLQSSPSEWNFQEGTGTIEIIGTNIADGRLFTLTGSLIEEPGHNHTHYLHFENLVLTYPAVPIPGTVWLLGTGFLGLWCLGRHRKK